jgi:hypothetical protein
MTHVLYSSCRQGNTFSINGRRRKQEISRTEGLNRNWQKEKENLLTSRGNIEIDH